MRGLRSQNDYVIKFILCMIICLLWALLGSVNLSKAAENLVGNSSFEEVESNVPLFWSNSAYTPGEENSKFSVHKGDAAHSGSTYVSIENFKPNDARMTQVISVKSNTLYKLSSWVKTENIGLNAKGANITVEGIVDGSADLKDTKNQWQLLEVYGQSGKKQKQITVTVRLGNYGSLNTGKASFDDITVEEAEAAPKGIRVINLDPEVTKQSAPAKASKGAAASKVRLFWWSILFITFFIFIYNKSIRVQPLVGSETDAKTLFVLLIFVAGMLRLLIAPNVFGYPSDVLSFRAWSFDVATNGLSKFYAEGKLADYPPGYMFVLYVLGKISQAFSMGQDTGASRILYKLPAMLADLVCISLIYTTARKFMTPVTAVAVASLYALNPAIILNSAAWGQIDSFFMLFILLAISYLIQGKIPLSTVLFALSVLIKPQALMFGPLLLLVFIRIRRDIKTIVISVVAGLLVLLIVPLPFMINQAKGPLYLIDLYTSTLSSYTYATLNAYNLIALTGGNWQPVTNKILFIPYTWWSYILLTGSLIYCGLLYFKSKSNDTKLYWIAFFFMTAVFMVTVKMHERYLFYALLPALMSFIHFRDRRILYLFFGFSLTHFFNADEVLANTVVEVYHINKEGGLLMFTSLVNTLLFIYMIKVGWDILVRNKLQLVDNHETKDSLLKGNISGSNHKNGTNRGMSKVGQATGKKVSENSLRQKSLLQQDVDKDGKLVKRDFQLIAGLTLVYTIIALFNLGSLKAPETFWKPVNAGENFYVSLGSKQTIQKVNSYGGPGDGSFKVEFSDDLQNWHDTQTIVRGGNVFVWNTLNVSVSAKYVKVIVEKPGFRLSEMAFYGPNNEKPLTIEAVVPSDKTRLTNDNRPSFVFDEQDQAAFEATYMNGTYFDEIYHARTAYEQLHRIEPYESTHPPLGKIIIGWGTLIFGMNPFGWRIMGTLFGIAMIPILYAFAKLLFRRTEYAFISAFLLTFDFMHFVQTRISTIDVYAVFFIILMYFYMYKYYRLSFYSSSLRQTLIPLALSGLFFGLGAASKWTAIYAGAGLAVIFFLSLYERYKEYEQAKRLIGSMEKHTKKEDPDNNYIRHVVSVFKPNAIKTVAWCTLFFVAIPLVIYVLSYFPFMLVPGAGHGLYNVYTYQLHMYDYHKNLVATHPFSSTWWEWPIMKRPLWYYGGPTPEGKISSIVALGNPAIWWVGIAAVFSTLWIGWKKKDKMVLFLFIAMCANYVPWMLVPRLTFIYHFFAMVPFLIFCIVYMIRQFQEKYPTREMKFATYSYLGIVMLLFVLFYPVLSGAIVNRSYAVNYLKWFSTWVF